MKLEIYRVVCDFCGKPHEGDEIDGMLSVQTALGPKSSREVVMGKALGKVPPPVPSGEFCDMTCLGRWTELPADEIMRRVRAAGAKEHEGHGHPMDELPADEDDRGGRAYL